MLHPTVICDAPSYAAGSIVSVRILSSEQETGAYTVRLTVYRKGDEQPLWSACVPYPAEYTSFWTIPSDALTGRYELVAETADPAQPGSYQRSVAASFVVFREVVSINRFDLNRTILTAGDPVRYSARLSNVTNRTLRIRAEFGPTEYSWIDPTWEAPATQKLVERLVLPPGSELSLSPDTKLAAPSVDQPSLLGYSLTIWDEDHESVLAAAHTGTVSVRPVHATLPKPYPAGYVYPNLASVRNDRQAPQNTDSSLRLDLPRTMFRAGEEVPVTVAIDNRTPVDWWQVRLTVSLLDGTGLILHRQDAGPIFDCAQGDSLQRAAAIPLPQGVNGVYRVQAEVEDRNGQRMAVSTAEVAGNVLPASILVVCPHPDDEFLHAGIIRAAAETGTPLRILYLTSGEAGGGERYFQRALRPEDAIEFAEIRMAECRAAVEHLGVTSENVHFLGLPDGGLEPIWSNHADARTPYRSVLTGLESASWTGVAEPNLAYARRPVLQAIQRLIRQWQPEAIYLPDADERHHDHRAANWLVISALQSLRREGSLPADLTVLVDRFYGNGPRLQSPFAYETHLLGTTGDTMAVAQEAYRFYQTQGGNHALGHVLPYERLARSEMHWQIRDWAQHEGWNAPELAALSHVA